jgi:predicted dehydrogenase
MGTAGSAIIDHDQLTYSHVQSPTEPAGDMGLDGGGNQSTENDTAAADPTVDHRGHTRQYADLVHAIATSTSPRVTDADALTTLALAAALYRSTDTGRVTPVEELLAELRSS